LHCDNCAGQIEGIVGQVDNLPYGIEVSMCLGVPGKLLEVHKQDDLPMGKVEFGGILKEVCLAYTPEAQVGDYVLVHVGFAISRIDETEAQEIFGYLQEIGGIEEEIASGEKTMPNEPPPSNP
jgi:hydrogenase expression/formation protein HypC